MLSFKNFFTNFFGKTPKEQYHFSILSGGGNYEDNNLSATLVVPNST